MTMMELRRRIMGLDKSGLPSAYQQVEYIETQNKQYIITNYYIASEHIKISADINVAVTWAESDLIGNQDNTNGRFVFGIYHYCFYGYAKDASVTEDNVVSDECSTSAVKYLVDAEYNRDNGTKSVTVNGVKYSAAHNASIISSHPVQIFADGKSTYTGGKRCYSLVLYDDGKLALNLIPCYRKADQKPGMYDLVSGEFYTNSGTGEFVVGADV